MINPDFQRFMAKRMRARATEVMSSHLSLISQHSEVLSKLILETVGRA